MTPERIRILRSCTVPEIIETIAEDPSVFSELLDAAEYWVQQEERVEAMTMACIFECTIAAERARDKAEREREEARDALGKVISLRYVDFAGGETTDLGHDAAVHAMATTIVERDHAIDAKEADETRCEEMREVLESVQWDGGRLGFDNELPVVKRRCPCCYGPVGRHEDDCALARALAPGVANESP